MIIKTQKLLHFLVIFSLAGCSLTEQPNLQSNQASTPEPAEKPTLTPLPENTTIPPTPTPELIAQICSPLDGDEIEELSEIITQPFKQPRPGIDDGDAHHGVDFAYFRRKERLSIDGVPVQAAIQGTVATIINDRFPYGNAIIIETPLRMIDPSLGFMSLLPEQQPTVMPDPRMVHCQTGELDFPLDYSEQSLYIVYAHFRDPVTLTVGEQVTCGQVIGFVGNTGDSSNPHLHFETRIGPSGARIESMAYYIADATPSERFNYCTWRVTNLFQLFEPMLFFTETE